MAGTQTKVGRRTLRLTNLDKVLYPATGTTKGDVIDYLVAVAPVLLPHAVDRPVTLKRWVHGVGTADEPSEVFFQKNVPDGTPDWVPTHDLVHRSRTTTYPVLDEADGRAMLAWFGQLAALELHVPQWRVALDEGEGRDVVHHPDRLVLDLDPGPGAGLPECVVVAHACREIVEGMGLTILPVTSGSKGIHLYAGLDGTASSDQVSQIAHELARTLEQEMPKLVVSTQSKAERAGKVLLDWSQNSGAKTTVAPYSLRGRERPTVAAPRSWDELDDDLAHLSPADVLRRVEEMGDLLAPLAPRAAARPSRSRRGKGGASRAEDPDDDAPAGDGTRADAAPAADRAPAGTAAPHADGPPADAEPADARPPSGTADRLATYRAKRDPARTPEPYPDAPVAGPAGRPVAGDEPAAGDATADARPTFVIQDHRARRRHHDFRLEHDGVLLSWALPRLTPADPARNHLAVRTEDHPLDYGAFEGTIPRGEYGAGEVRIWDAGTYVAEKMRDDEVIVELTGRPDGGLATDGGPQPPVVALIRTDGDTWLAHRIDPARRRRGPRRRPAPTGRSPAAAGHAAAGGAAAAHDGPGPSLTDLRPMLASPTTQTEQRRLAREVVPGGPWAVEMKWDGMRVLCATDPDADRIELRTRSGAHVTASFPELRALLEAAPVPAVLDAEVVALGPTGAPDFGLLQSRLGLDDTPPAGAVPVGLLVFDVLEVSGNDLTGLPYDARREALATVLTPAGGIAISEVVDLPWDEALATSRELGLEGLVLKRRTSTYQAGRRSRDWRKVKHVEHADVLVVGWSPGEGDRASTLGSLLLAERDGDGLRYVGRVGTGFRDATLTRLAATLTADEAGAPLLDDVPSDVARDARWVAHPLAAEVEHSGRTRTGSLRHPVWRGLRPDLG